MWWTDFGGLHLLWLRTSCCVVFFLSVYGVFQLGFTFVFVSLDECLKLSMCVFVKCACRGYSGVIYLVFLQVLEPFCPQSEQENLEAEELGISQPTSSTTNLIVSQTKLNASPPPSSSSSANHKDLSCTGSLAETETVSTPLAVTSSSSVPDAESVLPPLLSDVNSVSQPCIVSVPSNTQSGVLPAKDDSCVLPQPQSEPRISHHRQEEIRSNESNSSQIENSPPEIKVPNNLFESVV